jgi:hypothetical protein
MRSVLIKISIIVILFFSLQAKSEENIGRVSIYAGYVQSQWGDFSVATIDLMADFRFFKHVSVGGFADVFSTNPDFSLYVKGYLLGEGNDIYMLAGYSLVQKSTYSLKIGVELSEYIYKLTLFYGYIISQSKTGNYSQYGLLVGIKI